MTQNEKILNAIKKANQTKKLDLRKLSVHKGAGLNVEAIEKLLSDGSPIILTDIDNTTKDALLSTLGITLPGYSAFLLIRSLGKLQKQTVFHFIESNNLNKEETAMGAAMSGRYLGGGARPTVELDAPNVDEATNRPEKSILDIFAEAVVHLWDTVTLDSSKIALKSTDSNDSDPITKLWIWSKQYSQYCWGEKHNGYTPPDQTMTAYVTYTVQCYLNEAQTGNFQWMYVEVLGYWDTNIMKTNSSSHRGWGNLAVKPSVSTPSGFNFYSCSPTNTNKTKTVTSEVGFEVGLDKDGISGTYSVSKSQSEEISDWEVVLESVNNWKFQQYSPFKGYRTTFPNDAVYYDAGAFKYKLHGWPNLTKNTFNFCTMSVFKTNTVLTNTVSLPIRTIYEPGIVQIANSWPSWSGHFWYYQSTFSESFIVDMGAVT